MSQEKAKALMERLKREGAEAGYLLASDEELVLDLMDGLLTNEERYGYWSCPCREADGGEWRKADLRSGAIAAPRCFAGRERADGVAFAARRSAPDSCSDPGSLS